MSDQADPFDPVLRRAFAVPNLSRVLAAVDDAAARDEPALGRGRAWWIAVPAGVLAAAAVIVLARDERAPNDAVIHDARDHTLAARRRTGNALVELHARAPERPLHTGLGPLADPSTDPPGGACTGEGPAPRLDPDDALVLVAELGELDRACTGDDALPVARLFHLRRADGVDVLVTVDPLRADPRPLLPEDALVRLFRREIAGFVLYEVTPLDEPVALDRFAP